MRAYIFRYQMVNFGPHMPVTNISNLLGAETMITEGVTEPSEELDGAEVITAARVEEVDDPHEEQTAEPKANPDPAT